MVISTIFFERNSEREARQEIRESGALDWPLILGEAQICCGLAVGCIDHRARKKHRPIQLSCFRRFEIDPERLADWRIVGRLSVTRVPGTPSTDAPPNSLESSICSERFGGRTDCGTPPVGERRTIIDGVMADIPAARAPLSSIAPVS
jgi:hypothetical protein